MTCRGKGSWRYHVRSSQETERILSREALESISALGQDQEAREAMENGTHETEHFAEPRSEVPAGWEGGASGCQCPSLCKQTCWGPKEASSEFQIWLRWSFHFSYYCLMGCQLSCLPRALGAQFSGWDQSWRLYGQPAQWAEPERRLT